MEEWATLQELSHGGSNRNADCGQFCAYLGVCDLGSQVVERERRQKLGSSSSNMDIAVESAVH
jgi:hypothetical protein